MFINKKRVEFQYYQMFAVEGYDKNYNVYKDRVTIPMFIITGPEFQ